MLHLNNHTKEKKHQKPKHCWNQNILEARKMHPQHLLLPAETGNAKAAMETGTRNLQLQIPLSQQQNPREKTTSCKSVDSEAAQLRAKTFFDSVTVDLSSDIDEPPMFTDTMSDPEGNRDKPSSRANGISNIEVLPPINKDTPWSSHTPLSQPLHSNQHAATPQVRKESTSCSTSTINSYSTSSMPVTKKAILITPENNYHIPVSQTYHLSSQSPTKVIRTRISYVKTKIYPPRICPPF